MVTPRAFLLLQQARNRTTEAMPRNVFAYRAQQQLALHQTKIQDEIYLENGIEYEEYQRKSLQMKFEDSAQFKKIVEDQKEAVRAVITSNAEKTTSDKKND